MAHEVANLVSRNMTDSCNPLLNEIFEERHRSSGLMGQPLQDHKSGCPHYAVCGARWMER